MSAPTQNSTMPVMGSNQVGDLSNPIHAIFRRSNFHNISDDEYDALVPTLRLATRLLTTKELAGFPHALLVAPYGHWRYPNNDEEWWFQEKLTTLTAQDMVDYETTLSSLADMVVFQMVDTEKSGCGYCKYSNSTAPQGTHLQSCSEIELSREDVWWAVKTRDTGSELAYQKQCLTLAKLMCHELMHAMALARLGDDYPVPFDIPVGFQDAVETGYEWEQYVFGGLITHMRPKFIADTVPDDFEAIDLRIVAWPCASLTRYYVAKDYPIVVWKEAPSVEVHWLIDPTMMHTWISSLFSTHFWEHVVPQQGADAVKPIKQRGIRHQVDSVGKATAPADPFALPADTIPAGYEEDPVDGEVVVMSP
jgi:hypothetical protein